MNANDATLTALATTQTGSGAVSNAPNTPAAAGFDLVLTAVAISTLGSSGAPYTLTISAIDLAAVSQGWPTQPCTMCAPPALITRISTSQSTAIPGPQTERTSP